MRGKVAKKIRKEVYGNNSSHPENTKYHVLERTFKQIVEGKTRDVIRTQIVALGDRADYKEKKKEYYNGKT